MRYEKIENLACKKFRRLTGVKPETFKKMVEILSLNYAEKKKRGEHKSKIIGGRYVLIALEYWRGKQNIFSYSKRI